jgi:hypothetical protein
MSLEKFLVGLFELGRVRVTDRSLELHADTRKVDAVLVAFERRYRDAMPGTPPPVDLPAARYGAAKLYEACRFMVHPQLDEQKLNTALRDVFPSQRCPSVHYSVDLALRLLPDVASHARKKSTEDSLQAALTRLAVAWPLSSVGMPDVTHVVIDSFVTDDCLRRLYVDRIIECGDASRLHDQRIQDDVAAALGAHPELAPTMVQACKALGISLSYEEERP